jgi:hypothetical protein
MKTVDGFAIQDGFNFLSDIPKPELNPWCAGKIVKIEVADFYMNPRWVTWKSRKMWVADYEFFVMLLKSWIKPPKIPGVHQKGMTKEEALDLMFEMEV